MLDIKKCNRQIQDKVNKEGGWKGISQES
jgi:hypothetical protein